jgi:hypothetical protein
VRQNIKVTKVDSGGWAWAADTASGSVVMVSQHLVSAFDMEAGDEYLVETEVRANQPHPMAVALTQPQEELPLDTPVDHSATVLKYAIGKVVKAQARAARADAYLEEALAALKELDE